MELITLKQAVRQTKLSYQTLYANRLKYGFFMPENVRKWLVDPKVLDERLNKKNNVIRLASYKEVKKCQLKRGAKFGGLISNHQTAEELGALLKRKTKEKQNNCMTK